MLLLQGGYDVEAWTTLPLVIQKWVVLHAADESHAYSEPLFSIFVSYVSRAQYFYCWSQ